MNREGAGRGGGFRSRDNTERHDVWRAPTCYQCGKKGHKQAVVQIR